MTRIFQYTNKYHATQSFYLDIITQHMLMSYSDRHTSTNIQHQTSWVISIISNPPTLNANLVNISSYQGRHAFDINAL